MAKSTVKSTRTKIHAPIEDPDAHHAEEASRLRAEEASLPRMRESSTAGPRKTSIRSTVSGSMLTA